MMPSTKGAPTSDILTVTHYQDEGWVALDVTNIINNLNGKHTLDLMLVNIDAQGHGGYMEFSAREDHKEKAQKNGKHAPYLVIHSEQKQTTVNKQQQLLYLY